MGDEASASEARVQRAIDEGNREFEENNPGLARMHFSAAMRYIEAGFGTRDLLPALLGMTGRCLQRQKRFGEALQWYSQAADEARNQELHAQHFRWLAKLATTHLDMHDTETGIPLLERAIQFGRKLHRKKVPQVRDQLALELGRLANELQSDVRHASALWREAFDLIKKSSDDLSRFVIACNYGKFLAEVGHPRQAETYLDEALEIAGRAKFERKRVGEALQILAGVQRTLKAFERAGDMLLAELRLFDDFSVRFELLRSAVDAYYDGSAWEKMKTAAGDAWRMLTPDHNALARADMGVRYGIACREVGALEEARGVLLSAIADAGRGGDSSFQQRIRAELARVCFERGDYQEAVETYTQLWNEGFQEQLIAMRYPLALLAVGRVTDAKRVCDEYVNVGNDSQHVAIPRARIVEAEGGHAVEAWREAVFASDSSDRAMCLERLLEVLPDGEPERLKVSVELARFAESVRKNVNDIFSDNSWRAASPVAKDFSRYLETCLREAIALGRHDAAVYELERFRSQLLVDVLSERANLWAGDHAHLEEKSNYANKAQRDHYRYEALTAMQAGWAERRDAAEAAELSMELAHSAGPILFGRQIFGMQFPKDLNAYLKDTRLLRSERLVFQRVTPEGALLWHYDSAGNLFPTEVPEFTLKIAQRLETALRTEPDLRAVLEEIDRLLGHAIADPFVGRGTKHVFIVGGTDITNLPLDQCESLRAAGIQVGFLPTARALGFTRGRRFPTSALPFIQSARERREYAKEVLESSYKKAMVVIDPTRTLAYADLEGISVAVSLAPTHEVEIVDAPKVARRDVPRAINDVGCFHLISHGRFDSTNPYRTGMFLDRVESPRALWTAADVFGETEAPAGRLAVLSGCETGSSRGNLVSEEISLPSAFVAGGFASVVASRWPVDDLSAALLIAHFYRAWLSGRISVAMALRNASQWLRTLTRDEASEYLEDLEKQAAVIGGSIGRRMKRLCPAARRDVARRRATPFDDPRHWAAFYVIGDAGQRWKRQ
jgi:CHAT domain-containing protein/tetratricopeptide (TPR) repeat protein